VPSISGRSPKLPERREAPPRPPAVARESFPETNRRNTPPRPSPAEEAAERRGLEPRQPMPAAHRMGAAAEARPSSLG
ncbi:MAG: EpsI family ATP-binding protein, partial [Planctomycetota bacterium]